VSFNRINRKTGNRLKQQNVDSETGEVVSREDMVRGYEGSRLQNTVCFEWPCSARPAPTAASSMSYSMQIFGGDSSV
jgi:hypothetical protein